jgi:hypothetical protein
VNSASGIALRSARDVPRSLTQVLRTTVFFRARSGCSLRSSAEQRSSTRKRESGAAGAVPEQKDGYGERRALRMPSAAHSELQGFEREHQEPAGVGIAHCAKDRAHPADPAQCHVACVCPNLCVFNQPQTMARAKNSATQITCNLVFACPQEKPRKPRQTACPEKRGIEYRAPAGATRRVPITQSRSQPGGDGRSFGQGSLWAVNPREKTS